MRKHCTQLKNPARGEQGVITLDFIFALIIAFGFSVLFFAVSITLSMVEVSQYITFAASRAYMGGHEERSLQVQIGSLKFDELMEYPVFKTIYGLGWIQLGRPVFDNFSQEYPEGASEDNAIFEGARVPMEAKILNIRIPYLGTTAQDSSTGKATLNSYLMREVTSSECRENFNRLRYQKLTQLPGTPYATYATGKAILITDNGC